MAYNFLKSFFFALRAILVDGGVEIDRNVIQPINLSLNMNRKVFPSKGDGVPQFDISGALESIRVCFHIAHFLL